MNVEHEVNLLVQEIKRLGAPNADGQVSVTFGVLFNDDRCANIFEGINSLTDCQVAYHWWAQSS